MSGEPNCEEYQELFDRFDRLDAGEFERLREHAASCPDCAAILRAEEHLASPSGEELERAVPGEMVDGMWDRVGGGIGPATARRIPRARPHRRWIVPVQAAAIALLVLGAAALFGEVRTLRGREEALTALLESQAARLADLERRTSPAGMERAARRAVALEWERYLGGRETVSVAELRALLERAPEDALILGRDELFTLTRRLPRSRVAPWKEALAEIPVEEGLRAGQALRLIEALDASTNIPAERIIRISRGLPRENEL